MTKTLSQTTVFFHFVQLFSQISLKSLLGIEYILFAAILKARAVKATLSHVPAFNSLILHKFAPRHVWWRKRRKVAQEWAFSRFLFRSAVMEQAEQSGTKASHIAVTPFSATIAEACASARAQCSTLDVTP